MMKSALVVSVALLLGIVFAVGAELSYLRPYRAHIFHTYGPQLLLYALSLLTNLVAATYVFGRRLLLKDAGQKLRHLDREFKTRELDLQED